MPGALNQLRSLPKVEFHRHLDGSVRFETIVELARDHKIDLGIDPGLADFKQKLLCRVKITQPMHSLQEVLDSFWTTQKVQCSRQAMERIAYENVEDCFLDGVRLAELRFAPVFIAKDKSYLAYKDIIQGVIDGVERACQDFAIEVGLIHILPRSLSLAENIRATEEVFNIKKSSYPGAWRLVGIDLADNEQGTNAQDFVEIIAKAKDQGLSVTIHSGEDTSAEHVRRSIELYSPKRIGHGIKVWGNESVMDLLLKKGIHLEVCPTSNWLTHCVTSLQDHPLAKLYRAGISLSINSDDPRLMNIDLTNEYRVCRDYLGLDMDCFRRINLEALDHSFLPKQKIESIKSKYFTA